MTVDAAKELVAENECGLVCATVGPGDAFYIPAGFLFWEEIAKHDFAGVHVPLMCSSDLDCLQSLTTCLVGIGKPNDKLQKAVEALALKDES